MIRSILIFSLVCCAFGASLQHQSVLQESLGSFYHTTDQLLEEFQQLQKNCPSLTIDTSGKLPLVTLRQSDKPSQRVLMLFGEHARELISPESSLAMARVLCGQSGDATAQTRANAVLEQAEVSFFPVVNPNGRRLVESGQYCRRTNGNGVDLNRNWPAHWESDSVVGTETYSGPEPFSEEEVRYVNDVSKAYKPTLFGTVHSGTLGMYTPYAYSHEIPAKSRDMLQILKHVNPLYCNCHSGAAGKEVGYLCPGTCLDYMFDQEQVPHSFAVEIYDGTVGYKAPVAETDSFSFLSRSSQFRKSLARPHAAASCFIQTSEKSTQHLMDRRVEHRRHSRRALAGHKASHSLHQKASAHSEAEVAFPWPADDNGMGCLQQYNPLTREDYDKTVDNWGRAYVDIMYLHFHPHATL